MVTRNRRTLTPQQQEASDKRRAQFRELARAIGAMTDEQRAAMAARMVGVVTIEGRALSIHNSCLVATQNPAATVLGGFQQWRAAGRVVRKGEHGLMIWAPRHPAATGGTPSTDVAAARQPHEPGSAAPHARELESDRPAFLMVTVFDISQTDEAAGQ